MGIEYGQPHRDMMTWLGVYRAATQIDESGLIRSRIFPGLDLPVVPLFAGDLSPVLAQVQKNIATETHKVFVDQLAHRRSPGVSNPKSP